MKEFSRKAKRGITILVLSAVLLVNVALPIYSANAVFGISDIVFDPINDISNALSAAFNAVTASENVALVLKEYVLDPLANVAAQTIIRAMTNQILGWIQGEDVGFVQNLDQEFRRAADAAGGELLNQITGLNLCGNIGAFLNITLRTPGLRQRLECTVTDIIRNLDSFYQNFQQGGWPAFIRITLEPQNTAAGAYLFALDAKIQAENRARERIQEGVRAGGGFLGFRIPKKVCNEISAERASDIENSEVRGDLERIGAKIEQVGAQSTSERVRDAGTGRSQICQTEYETKTPGSLVAEGLKKSVYSGLDSALLADELNEAVAVILTALLNKVITASTGKGAGILDKSVSTLPPPEKPPVVDAFLTSRVDEPILRIQATQLLVGQRIANLDKQIFAKNIRILQLESCASCNAVEIDLLKQEKAPLETAKGEETRKLDDLDKALADLVTFRNSIIGIDADNSGALINASKDLTALQVQADRAIQRAEGPLQVTVSSSSIENTVEMTNQTNRHAAAIILLLDQKISQVSTSTATTTITIQMQSLRNVLVEKQADLQKELDALVALRLRLIAARDNREATLDSLIAESLRKVIQLNAKITQAYKL